MSLGTLVFAAAVVAGGTGAFFSDTEVSTGNVFTAGSVSLDLNEVLHDYGGDVNNAPIFDWRNGQGRFTLDDLKPLDEGQLNFDLINGANEAHVCAMIQGDPGDLTDANDIALYDQLNFFVDGDGAQVVPGQWFDLGIVDPNSPTGTGVDYCFGEPNVDGTGLVSCDYGDGSIAYNDAQNGSFSADILFYAIQTRNNDNFTCDQLTMDDGEPVYVPGPTPVDPVDAEGPTDGWNGAGALIWQAEGRFGNGDTGSNQTWELGVGNDTQSANSANAQYTWANGVAVPFSVSYDGNDATFTIDGVSQTYTVGAVTSAADLNIIAGKVSAGTSDSVALANLELDGAPVNPATLTDTDDTDAQYLVVSTEDLSGGFTLTGDVTFTWTGGTTSDSRPAFQVQVRD
jgi:predicted ribosomally synthesized peptide with SipW-like signal peptide